MQEWPFTCHFLHDFHIVMTDHSSPSPTLQASGRRPKSAPVSTNPSQAVLTCIATLWLSSIVAGLLLHQDLSDAQLTEIKRNIPFLWFDQLLKRYGALLPFVPFAFRWWAAALSEPGRGGPTPAQFAEAGVIYVGLTLARAFAYILHITGVMHLVLALLGIRAHQHGVDKRSHLVSDHMVLGASLTAILATEIGLGLTDLKHCLEQQRLETFRLISVVSALLLSAFLCIGTIVDMFYTARYFHGAKEVFSALLLGYFLFQAPLGYWLLRGSRQVTLPNLAHYKRSD